MTRAAFHKHEAGSGLETLYFSNRIRIINATIFRHSPLCYCWKPTPQPRFRLLQCDSCLLLMVQCKSGARSVIVCHKLSQRASDCISCSLFQDDRSIFFHTTWTRMPSLEQRKAQNRAAQRKFRENKKRQERQLAVKNEELMLEISKLKARLEFEAAIDKPSHQVGLESRDPDPVPQILGWSNTYRIIHYLLCRT